MADRAQVCGPTLVWGMLAGLLVGFFIVSQIDAQTVGLLPKIRMAFAVFVVIVIAVLFLMPLKRVPVGNSD